MDIAMTAPVGQNQIHINLINYKHRCMRQFFREFFGESHRYGLWNSLFPIYLTFFNLPRPAATAAIATA